jgi:hypothetical protein
MLCQMTKSCKSFAPDDVGECLHFVTSECKFVSDRQFSFACDACVHAMTKHVDPRCKNCKLKDAVTFVTIA